jgi:glycosyltransferase involved in cell wall biosynthesis
LQKEINIVHYWGGVPISPTSKWLRTLMLIEKCQKNGFNNWLVLSEATGCKVIYFPRSKGNFDLQSIYRNFKFLRKIECNVFHCHNDHTSPIIGATFASVPVKIWSKLSMSFAYEKGIKLRGIGRLMLSTRITCLFASRVLAISDAVKYEVCSQIGFKDKIDVVNAPVPIDKFIKATGNNIREEFNIPSSDVVITAVGHFAEVKGWDIAVEAFKEINITFPNTKLLLVGKKTSLSFYNKINAFITVHNLQDKIIIAGNRSDIPEILKASNLFVFPSRSEGAGAALIEAMAAGLPCIATNIGGIPGIIENGKNGLLFTRENSTELVEKISLLLTDAELNTQLIQNAKQDLSAFTIDTYVESVFTLYKKLLIN